MVVLERESPEGLGGIHVDVRTTTRKMLRTKYKNMICDAYILMDDNGFIACRYGVTKDKENDAVEVFNDEATARGCAAHRRWRGLKPVMVHISDGSF